MADQYKPVDAEAAVMNFWEENDTYQKLKKRNAKGPKWTFLQGPPYTSGRLHMGHAWNHALKDMAMRYRRMKGFNVWDRAGYDMHGLPTEHKVQAKFELKTKDDIERFGFERFAKECYAFSTEMAKLMDKDLLRVGVWMDYSNPYYPVTNDFMETEWWFVKQAHEKGRLYRSERTLSWCRSCATALAKHEQDYKEITDDSIFLKFGVSGKKGEFLIIWTTTPWTIAFNLGIMVNPEVDYVKMKVEGETWTVAKPLAHVFVAGLLGKKYEIIEEFKGEKLAGLAYDHPWIKDIKPLAELKAANKKIHTVVLSNEYVDTSAGTGLVHMAPGCGPEDYEVGYRNGIPPFNNLTETGQFPQDMGRFSGMTAKKDDAKFVAEMKKDGFLIESTPVKHEYAHCQRCGNPIVFRTTKQWFFKVEDIIPLMRKNAKEVNWVPAQTGEAFDQWIAHLRDNSITKQRFWGTPVPIWKCDKCEHIEVIGSVKELKEKATTPIPANLHKPWIDDVKLKCVECEGSMTRFEDVIDVWVDSGVTQWACFYYPQRTDLFEKNFPVDFILEAKEQVRLWYYMLSLCQAMVTGKQPYKNVFSTGMLLAVDGVKMSKSLGNIISPYTIIDKHGADTMRSYLCSIDAGLNVSFSWKEIENKQRNLIVLWNLHNFVLDLADQAKQDPAKMDELKMLGDIDTEERFMFSRINSATKAATQLFEEYNLHEVPGVVERLMMDLSRTYIQLVREKAAGTDDERAVVLFTSYNALMRILELLAPVCPFISESIYQRLRKRFNLLVESIHMVRWPLVTESAIDYQLEENMTFAQNVMQAALYGREKLQRSLRWPLPRIYVVTQETGTIKAIEQLRDSIKRQVNVKEVILQPDLPEVKETISVNRAMLGKSFGAANKNIEAALGKQNLAAVLREIRGHNKFTLKHATGVAELMIDHFNVERLVPKHLVEVPFQGGLVYVDNEVTPALEAEGYSRELTRRIQQLRKDAGLVKDQRIHLHVQTEKDMITDIKPFTDALVQKVNADKILFSELRPTKEFKHNAEAKIKGKGFFIWMDVL